MSGEVESSIVISKAMKLKSWLVVAAFALLIIAVVIIGFLTAPAPKPNFQILFLGVTNEPALGQVATFSVSNYGSSRLLLNTCPPQVKRQSGWSSVLPPQPAGMVIEPGDVQTFEASVPAESEAWRVPVYWGYEPMAVRRVVGIAKYNWNINRIRLERGRSLRFISSPQVDTFLEYGPEIKK